MKMSVILSTYNSPKWLEKVLWGYLAQTEQDFEMVIADDGSKDDTRQLIESFQGQFKYPIVHVWHEDNGFQKTIIMNKAILASNSNYLLFSDGDCIPRNDFVEVHLKFQEKGYFLSGGYYKLPMNISQKIDHDNIKNQDCFNIKWLKSEGLPLTYKNLKFVAKDWKLETLLNKTTTTKPSWNGHGASDWKEDILSVNGFDERMEYGAEDREMGERMWNLGIKSKQIRYSAICIHLDHARGYVRKEALDKNRKIWNETKKLKKTITDYGIEKRG
jgi:glycosyltransferase involved in cell wall biosynthesis